MALLARPLLPGPFCQSLAHVLPTNRLEYIRQASVASLYEKTHKLEVTLRESELQKVRIESLSEEVNTLQAENEKLKTQIEEVIIR